MNKKLLIAIMAVASASNAMAQSQDKKNEGGADNGEAAFTFTESQPGEDDDMNQNVPDINSNNNIYDNPLGYQFSPVSSRYRAFNQQYNDD